MRRWIQFLLLTGVLALLAWLFNEPSGTANAKFLFDLFGLDSKPDVKEPQSAPPQPAPTVPPPTKNNEGDEMAAARAEEERKARARRAGGAEGTVLTSSLNFDDSDSNTNKNRSVKKTVLGAGA